MNDSKFLSHEDRETLQRAVGILEGLKVNPDISEAVTCMLEAVIEMMEAVLK